MTQAVPEQRSFPSTIARFVERFDPYLESLFAKGHAGRSNLGQAMRYAVLAGGKRLRPFLVTECCTVCGGDARDAMPAALAIECVHTFSLVHDDLPAMDDDDLRRGKPTCHKVYGEAMGILAGDALLTIAFELLAGEGVEARVSQAWTRELADAVGWNGMIAGQADDITAEGDETAAADLETVHAIHALKTARLFRAACELGAIAARANAEHRTALGEYGHQLGLAFQITDDVLDVTSTAGAMGKNVAKDQTAGKLTHPGIVGVEGSRVAAAEASRAALASLDVFGPQADELKELARFIRERDH